VRACGDFALVEVPIDRVAEVRADAEDILLAGDLALSDATTARGRVV